VKLNPPNINATGGQEDGSTYPERMPCEPECSQSVREGRPKDWAKLRTVWKMAFLVATKSYDVIVRNEGDELRDEDCGGVH
jgi:hypothetical protein